MNTNDTILKNEKVENQQEIKKPASSNVVKRIFRMLVERVAVFLVFFVIFFTYYYYFSDKKKI